MRRRAEVAATACLAAAVILAPATAGVGLAAVQSAIDENWRGSYDILVLADSSSLVSTSEAATLLDPNFANTSAQPIPNDLAEAVDALPGVALAAPVGFLGRLWDVRDFPIVQMPAELLKQDPVRTVQLRWTVRTDDGLGSRIADHQVFDFAINASAWDGISDVHSGDPTISVASHVPVDITLADGTVRIGFWPLPTVASTVFAVEPQAELELLGDNAPAAMHDLLAADESLTAIQGGLGRWPTGENLSSIIKAGGADFDRWGIDATEPALNGQYGRDGQLAPVITASDALPTLQLTVDFAISGPRSTGSSGALTDAGTVTVDAGSELSPFASTGVVVPWPGFEGGEPTTYVQPALPTGVGSTVLSSPPQEAPPNPDENAYTLAPMGMLRAVPLDRRQVDDGRGVGQTQTYRADGAPTSLQIGDAQASGRGAPLIVGSYENDSLDLEELDAAPLGAYDPARVTRLTTGDGTPVSPTQLAPSLTGLGIVAQPATAITSITGARALGVADPITAIRVRVADVGAYSPQSMGKIIDVASAIEALGLQAYIVAGSSRQSIQVWVPDYAFGVSDPDEPQVVSDLGWVELDAVSLNVAQSTVSTLTTLASAISAGSVIVAFGALPLLARAQIDKNRRNEPVLRFAGWSRGARFRWFAAEGAPGALIVVLAALAGWLLAGSRGDETPGALALAACVSVAAMAVVLCVAAASSYTPASRRPRLVKRGRRRPRPPVAVLAARRAPMMVASGFLVGVVSSAFSMGVTVILLASSTASRTALGSLLSQTQLPFLLASLVSGLLAAIVLLCALTSRQSAASAVQASTLTRVGSWSRAPLNTLASIEIAVLGASATVVVVMVAVIAPDSISPLVSLGPRSGIALPALATFTPVLCVAVARVIGERRALRQRADES